MKIIDAHGRVFGKINIIDLSVAIFIAIILTGTYMGYKAYKKTGKELVEDRWLRVQIKFAGVFPELSRVIAEGDLEKSKTDTTIATLEKIVANKPTEVIQFVLQENKFISVPNPILRDIVVDLKAYCYKKNGVIYYKKTPLRISDEFVFTTDLYSIKGMVIDLARH